jgi:hypothetical protein
MKGCPLSLLLGTTTSLAWGTATLSKTITSQKTESFVTPAKGT